MNVSIHTLGGSTQPAHESYRKHDLDLWARRCFLFTTCMCNSQDFYSGITTKFA